MVSKALKRSNKTPSFHLCPRSATFKRRHTPTAQPIPPPAIMNQTTENPVPNPHDNTTPLTSLNLNHWVKLNSNNYTSWRFQLTHILFGLSLLGFIDSSHPQPSPTITSDDKSEKPNPAYYTWLKQDGLILGALMGTLSATIQAIIVRATTSKEAWDILGHTYANPSRTHILQLKDRLDSIFKTADQSITEYMHAIKACIDQLALLGKVLDPEDVVLTAAILTILFKHKRKQFQEYDDEQQRGSILENNNVHRFNYKKLESATNGFREEVGRGSFGVVYKGKITSGGNSITVAVKKLDRIFMGADKEFTAEVNAIGLTHHKNLVRFIGYCKEEDKRLLVYINK